MPHALTTVVTCGAGDQNFDKLCLDTQLELGLLCLFHPIWLNQISVVKEAKQAQLEVPHSEIQVELD